MRSWWSTNSGRFFGQNHSVYISEKSPRASSVGSSFGTTIDRGFDFIPATPPPQLPTAPTVRLLQDDVPNDATETAAVSEAPLTLAPPVSADSRASTWSLSFSAVNDVLQPPSGAYVSARRSSRSNSLKSGPLIFHGPPADAHVSPIATADVHTLQGGAQPGAVMTIHRSFLSSRHDEMSVSPEDNVRIVKLYDGGWVAVEPVNAENDIFERPHRFIPVDCLRWPGDGSSQ